MPTGPKGEKRPRDPNQLAKLIVDIAQVKLRTASLQGRYSLPKRKQALHPTFEIAA
jgi:hypothetical protein